MKIRERYKSEVREEAKKALADRAERKAALEEMFRPASQEEIDSVYNRNGAFLDMIKEERAQKAFKKGKYQTIEEARERIAMPSLMSVVKNIAYKKSVSKNSLEEKKAAMDFIIRDLMELTPIQFYTHFSVQNNKKWNLYHVINQIADEAPDEVRIECAFNTKRTFFREMYPEIFGKELNLVSGYEIFFCDEDVKAGLGKVANTEKYIGSKKAKYYGDIVDRVLMDAIDMVLDANGLKVGYQAFCYLGEETSTYFNKGFDPKNSKPAGINDLVKKRGYTRLLDFYFLNCPPEIQLEYVEDFMKVRDQCYIPENELMEKLARTKVFLKQRAKAKEAADPETILPEEGFVKVDEYKYRRAMGEKKYEFLEATPVDNGDYLVYSGIVNLFNYTPDKLKKIIEEQYGSQEAFVKECSKLQDGDNKDIFPYVAEAVFNHNRVKPLKTKVHKRVSADEVDSYLQQLADRRLYGSDDLERG